MHFLNPIWFLAVAAVLIPVVIHLWNITPGKTLKVGSIALMGEASRQSSRSFRLLDILLLMLRCLILVSLAGLLAMPLLSHLANNSKIKGWVMIPGNNFKETYARFKKPVDSLTAAGYEFHYFNAGFAKANLLEVLKDTTKVTDSTAANYWDMLARLNGKAPARLPVYLFTDNAAKHFGGNKPTIIANLKWQTYSPADSTSEWLEKAWFTKDNNIRVVKGDSHQYGTTFSTYTVQPGQSNALFNAAITNGGVTVSLKSKPQQTVIADTSVFRIAVVADNGEPDANYLNAALKAIAPLIPHNVKLVNYTNALQVKQKQTWLFWLAKKPVDVPAAQLADNLFVYQTGKEQVVNSWLGNVQVPVYKLIISEKKDEQIVWHDGFGKPVLTSEQSKGFKLYRFYSRFSPAWSDLVWNDNFPRMLLALVSDEQLSAQSAANDKRVMAYKQMMPVMSNNGKQTLAGMADDIDLSHYVWLVLILAFFAERWLSHQKTKTANG
ncbi:BatA domain-containing protein [Mucilaginibacter sp. HMF5004]|uniref:BatA domain-containing protein n=1 Tax=Mucilaginibacter rivuli TaxID=2857527 RepID=UPI001C5E8DB7|nr:BatA domain-containing protein [Mucilaginibacter rivuli]MBW4888291.1 BatA domain-containing protein [Mucilaginibacter rivuli]